MEFHVSRQARDRYQFDQALFSLSGNVIFANFHAARTFAQKINQKRDLVNFPENIISAGQINALGLIDEILHHLIALYRQQANPQALALAFQWLESHLTPAEIEHTLMQFSAEFPPLAVYRGEISLSEYMQETTDGMPNRQAVLEEMILLWVTNQNPAVTPYLELFNDKRLSNDTAYLRIMAELQHFFETQPKFGPDPMPLIALLRSPAVMFPDSLTSQLEYIRERWGEVLGGYLYRLLSSLDLIKEEEKVGFFGPGPTAIPVYDLAAVNASSETEVEAFSEDREWMPRLVLMAKNTYVWLDQLSKKHQRSITRLDQIPEEDLADLAAQGFTGLWLIGLWERSRASAQIKKLCGNPDALASAYSLYDYSIAADLGGEEAYQTLRHRAWQHGIRLASDMVPNHMGIDSNWVVDHPDWFISLDYSPFPSYTFNGPDLSNNPAVSINLEDHYYSRDDAAVVFKLYDHRNGQNRFVYHGNDGTTMPWNDTAQLNYLNPEVREAVIQTILAVARRFPIIRFDAAMTLAKRHFQRLWYPEPGTGGDIPSRAEHSMTKAQFDETIPVEFWREVVDRVAKEAPDTLLLAEAFWMMEGYFVRTLGMHRVYNSAFMNMLRNEENAKYRTLIKNTLEFDPEILKRYVNFMNNPDERTAVDQFGKGDKYFGICTLMSTLPGLPMFGHGQIEGYSEKYGMEFRKPLWDEQPDPYLVERHHREITPILQHRAVFAGVDNFLLYDFFTPTGSVDENVFAYSNGQGAERGLVIFQNRYGSSQGWLRTSVGHIVKGPNGERSMTQHTLAEGLNLHAEDGLYTIFRDQVTGLEHIYASRSLVENGLFLSLNAYECHVYMDFHEVHDDEWQSYRHLNEYLKGRGVPSVHEAMRELTLQPVLNPFRQIANPGYFNYLLEKRLTGLEQSLSPDLLDEAEQKLVHLLDGIGFINGQTDGRETVLAELRPNLIAALSLDLLDERYPMPGSKAYRAALSYLQKGLTPKHTHRWIALFTWIFVHNLGKLAGPENFEAVTRTWIEEYQFGKVLAETARSMSIQSPDQLIGLVNLLIEEQNWFSYKGDQPVHKIMTGWLSNPAISRFVGVNRYQEILWFNQEALESFLWWMNLLAVAETLTAPNASASLLTERILLCHEMVQKILKAEKGSGFQLQKLLAAL